jgi:hypothetical protein
MLNRITRIRTPLRTAHQPLDADIDEAQSDHHIHEGRVELPTCDRGDDQRQGVPEHEQRDQLRGRLDRPGDQDDAKNEQQVVPAADHVQEADPDVLEHRPVRVVVREQGVRKASRRDQQ